MPWLKSSVILNVHFETGIAFDKGCCILRESYIDDNAFK